MVEVEGEEDNPVKSSQLNPFLARSELMFMHKVDVFGEHPGLTCVSDIPLPLTRSPEKNPFPLDATVSKQSLWVAWPEKFSDGLEWNVSRWTVYICMYVYVY